MTYPAILSHIRLFSFFSAYFVSEMREDINTYLDDILFRYPAIRSHSLLLIFRPLSTFSKSWQELLRINGPHNTRSITPPELRPADRSGPRSSETTIFLEVGLVMSGSRSELKGATKRVWFWRRDLWGSILEGSLNTQSMPSTGSISRARSDETKNSVN